MASGIINGTTSNQYIQSRLRWSSTSEIATNKSVLTIALEYNRTNHYSGSTGGLWSGSISVNGQRKPANSDYTSNIQVPEGNQWVTAYETTFNVTHDEDGSKTVAAAGYGGISGTSLSSTNCGGNIVLDKIARKATITSAASFDGKNTSPSFTYSNSAGNAVTLTALLYARTSQIASRKIDSNGTSYTFNLTDDEYKTLYNELGFDDSITVMYFLQTNFNQGGTSGSDMASATFTPSKDDLAPTIEYDVVDSNSYTLALTGNNHKFIKYKSIAKATVTGRVNPQLDTYIQSVYIRHDGDITSELGQKGNVSLSAYQSYQKIDSPDFEFEVWDKLQHHTTAKKTIEFIPYIKLTCQLGNDRPDALGNYDMTVSGNYFNDTFGKKHNTLTVKYRYKESSKPSSAFTPWKYITPSISGNSYTARDRITGLDYQTIYNFEAQAEDELSIVSSGDNPILSTPVFDWSKTDFNFNVPVTFNGGVEGSLASTTKAGFVQLSNTLDGSDDKALTPSAIKDASLKEKGVVQLTETIDDSSTTALTPSAIKDASTQQKGIVQLTDVISNSSTTALTPSAIKDLNISSGNWFPYCDGLKNSGSGEGWYLRIGNVVSVGWYLTGRGSYTDQYFIIRGLPFTPDSGLKWQAGGGTFTGGNAPNGHDFSGYCIDNGVIYARTSSGGSSSYAGINSNGTIYSSGTITYRI